MKFIFRPILFGFLLFQLLSCSYFPDQVDQKDLTVSETVKYIRIGDGMNKGLIFYPGGLVDPYAYLTLFENLDFSELSVFICKSPFNLAILDINQAEAIRKAFPLISEWTLAGHSLGGATAAFELGKNINAYANLVLLAAYPAEGVDLTDFEGTTAFIFGSQDGVLDFERLQNSLVQFPSPSKVEDPLSIQKNASTTFYLEIEGGNHSNFGSYGFQSGDNPSLLSREEQMAIVQQVLRQLL